MQSERYNAQKNYMFEHRCDSINIFTNVNRTIDYRAINDTDFTEPYFQIEVFRGEDEDRDCYYISMLEPRYIIDPDLKLTEEEKQILFDEITVHGMWKKLIDAANGECEECEYCAQYFHKGWQCDYYHNRKIPDNPPDYRLLP